MSDRARRGCGGTSHSARQARQEVIRALKETINAVEGWSARRGNTEALEAIFLGPGDEPEVHVYVSIDDRSFLVAPEREGAPALQVASEVDARTNKIVLIDQAGEVMKRNGEIYDPIEFLALAIVKLAEGIVERDAAGNP